MCYYFYTGSASRADECHESESRLNMYVQQIRVMVFEVLQRLHLATFLSVAVGVKPVVDSSKKQDKWCQGSTKHTFNDMASSRQE